MKLINKYLMLGLMAGTQTVMISCSDSFLQKDSLTEISSSTFWQTPEDAMMALTACYDALQSSWLYNDDMYCLGPLYMDCMTDNGGHFNWSGWMPGYDVPMGIQNSSSWAFSDYWKACYEVINRCNLLIANIDRVNGLAESDKACYRAEAISLRSLIYINLIMTYQDVPYLTEPLTLENAACAKTDRETIVENVMVDLKNCIEILPKTIDRGRINKGAALAFLGRVALYNEKWSDAIAAYREIMNMGYSLYDDYKALFSQAGETSKEIIFAVRYEGPGQGEGACFNAHWNTPMESLNGTLDLADDYYIQATGLKTTDTNYGEMNGGVLNVSQPSAAHFEGRDPRLYTTLFVPGMYWNGKGGETAWYGGAAASLSMVYVMKYFDDTDTNNSWDNGQDFYVVRYPEVLLSLAEALVQSGDYDEAEVRNLINQVRQRPSVSMPRVEDVEGTGLSADQLLEVIKHERRVELAFEGLRLFDLYRWHELEKSITNIEHERTSLGLAYEPRSYNGERDYVWPIPLNELNSNPMLEQHKLWQ